MGRKKKRLRLIAKLEANKPTPVVEIAKVIEPVIKEEPKPVVEQKVEEPVEEPKVEVKVEEPKVEEIVEVEKTYKRPTIKKTTTKKTSRKKTSTSKK